MGKGAAWCAALGLLAAPAFAQRISVTNETEGLVTGTQEVRLHLPQGASVEWYVNGRAVEGEGYAVQVPFGSTPRHTEIEAHVVGKDGETFTVRRQVNAGGLGATVTFLRPLDGSRAEGSLETQVCVADPGGSVDSVTLIGPDGAQPMGRVMSAACPDGVEYTASVTLDGDVQTLTARLGNIGGSILEESVLVNSSAFQGRTDVINLRWPVRLESDAQPERDKFSIFEDRNRLVIADVQKYDNVPLRLGFVLDSSPTTKFDGPAEWAAAHAFLKELLRPQDKAFIGSVGREYMRFLGWTSDVGRVQQTLESIAGLTLGSGTALYDGIIRSLYDFQHPLATEGNALPALILVTDGRDDPGNDQFGRRNTTYTREQALAYVRESGVPIYAIEITTQRTSGDLLVPDATFLDELVAASGGAKYEVTIKQEATMVARALREKRRELQDLYNLREHPEGQPPDSIASSPKTLAYFIGKTEEEVRRLDGRLEELSSAERLRDIFSDISDDIRRTILVTAVSEVQRTGGWHEVRVDVEGHASHSPRGFTY